MMRNISNRRTERERGGERGREGGRGEKGIDKIDTQNKISGCTCDE